MRQDQAPPPPPDDADGDYEQALKPSPVRWLGILAAIIVLGLGIWAGLRGTEPEPPDYTPAVPHTDKPAIRLQPSLVVTAPAPQPRPAQDGETARHDDAVLFRVNVSTPGYVLLGFEDERHIFHHIWGGRPDDKPIERTALLADPSDNKVIAFPLKDFQGRTLTFVAVLSDNPWTDIPRAIPQQPRSFPKDAPDAHPPAGPWSAWDRFTLHVGIDPKRAPKNKQTPTPTKEED